MLCVLKGSNMDTTVSFSFHSSSKRKRQLTTSHDPTTSKDMKPLVGVFLSAKELAQEAIDEASSSESQRPQKKALLLEGAQAKVKRLQAEGNTLAEAGRFRAAMGRWKEAITIDPLNAILYELLAQAAMALGDDFDAVQYGLKAVEYNPSWGDAYHTLARCHLNFGELELALANIKKAEELLGAIEELVVDRQEIKELLHNQRVILAQRDLELTSTADDDKLQVISCMKHLSLRGQVG